jgi:predicted phage-related endonuclease
MYNFELKRGPLWGEVKTKENCKEVFVALTINFSRFIRENENKEQNLSQLIITRNEDLWFICDNG